MNSPSVPRTDYYVYALFREDGTTPFYIGKGRGPRMYKHEGRAKNGKNPKDLIIQEMRRAGIAIRKEKLLDGLPNKVALQIERDLIRLIGRQPTGPLTNMTDGGEGAVNLFISAETIEKKRVASIASWQNPECRARRLKGMRETFTPEWRAQPQTQEFERQRIEKIRLYWADPENRNKAIQKRREYIKDHPVSDDIKAIQGARLNSPEAIAKRQATGAIPEVRNRRVAAQRAAFSTPEAKAKRSNASKKMWAAKKAQKTAPDARLNESQPQ